MRPIDFARAAGVGFTVFVSTLLLSIPMVAFYSYVIEPGHPQQFYNDAAKWIAPWSSHVFGPLIFLWLNYRGARKHQERTATLFALATVCAYFIIDLASVPLFGISFATVLTTAFFASLAVKTAGALVGAAMGARMHQSGSL